jgi:ribosomal protein S27AE
MKHCKTCNTEKKKSDFGNRKASIDGLSPKCKQCMSTYDKERANDPKRVLARAEYAKTDNGIAAQLRSRAEYVKNNKPKIAESNRRYVAANPKKRAAHTAVEKQLMSIVPCETCGSISVSAHHDDYDKPLDVRWLCSKHHREWHKENGAGLNG